jgi:hypothetical protein
MASVELTDADLAYLCYLIHPGYNDEGAVRLPQPTWEDVCNMWGVKRPDWQDFKERGEEAEKEYFNLENACDELETKNVQSIRDKLERARGGKVLHNITKDKNELWAAIHAAAKL